MNVIRQLAVTVVAGAATLVCLGANANNGLQTVTLDLSHPGFYTACLGELLEIKTHAVISYHEFNTPKGKYHYFEKFDATAEITGLTSQDTWFARMSYASPIKVGPGQTAQWTENWIALPVTRDGPRLRMHLRFKMTVNANGDLVVDHDDYDWSQAEYFLECIGKPQ